MNRNELKALIGEVLAVLEESGVPEELRPTAFERVWLEIRSGTAAGPNGQPSASKEGSPDDPFAALATKVGVEPEQLADLYGIDDDGLPTVRVPANQLPSSKTAATVELALLVCAGRQASGEQETTTKVIRELCDHYGKFDSGNFASTLTGADRYWQMTGKGQSRSLRLRMPGWEAATQSVGRLAGIS